MTGRSLKQVWEDFVKPPEGWQGDLYFFNQRNQKIRYGFAPATGESKGSIVLTHGYGEHVDLYYDAIKKYQKMGYDVWAMDWLGQGRSERENPNQPLIPSAKGMLRHTRDLDFFVQNVVKTRHDDKKPLIMSTHSMGGHIGLLYLKKFPGVFDGAVMSAPMFDIYRLGLGTWARPGIRFIFNAASHLGFRDTPVPELDTLLKPLGPVGSFLKNIFSRPSAYRDELRSRVEELTPEAHLGRPTFGWIAAAFKTIVPSMEPDFLRAIKTPVLIGSAEHEDLVDNKAHAHAASLMPHATHVKINGAGHGLWFEDDAPYETWWKHVASFIGGVAPGPKSSFERMLSGKEVARSAQNACDGGIRFPNGADPCGPQGPTIS